MKHQNTITRIEIAIENSKKEVSKLNPDVCNIQGFTSNKVRHLLNNLADKDTHYLEIGVFAGATFCAALSNNEFKSATAIDDFSEFGGDVGIFVQNCAKHLDPDKKVFVKEQNSWDIKKKDLPAPINLYFYDGGHTEADHWNAIVHYFPMMDNLFILVVDDYLWPQVKSGTAKGLEDIEAKVLASWELPADFNGDTVNYWNGIGIFLIEKK